MGFPSQLTDFNIEIVNSEIWIIGKTCKKNGITYDYLGQRINILRNSGLRIDPIVYGSFPETTITKQKGAILVKFKIAKLTNGDILSNSNDIPEEYT
jgi:hypothetical protein